MSTLITFVPLPSGFTAADCAALLNTPARATTESQRLQAGLVSYSPEGSLSFAQFAAKITGLVKQASDGGARLVVLPELLVQDLIDHDLGEDSFGPQVRRLSKYWPKFLALNQKLARQHGIFLYSGTFPRPENGRIYNTGALIFPDGHAVEQDKLFMTPFEKRWELSPGTQLKVIETPWGNWVNLICYDCEIPALSHLLASVKPTLILVPSMTEAPSGFSRVRWTAQARAIEHKAYVVHTGMTGGPAAWPNYGQCSVTAPYDDVLCGTLAESAVNTPGILNVDLDFAKLQRSRQSDSVYPGRDQSEAAP